MKENFSQHSKAIPISFESTQEKLHKIEGSELLETNIADDFILDDFYEYNNLIKDKQILTEKEKKLFIEILEETYDFVENYAGDSSSRLFSKLICENFKKSIDLCWDNDVLNTFRALEIVGSAYKDLNDYKYAVDNIDMVPLHILVKELEQKSQNKETNLFFSLFIDAIVKCEVHVSGLDQIAVKPIQISPDRFADVVDGTKGIIRVSNPDNFKEIFDHKSYVDAEFNKYGEISGFDADMLESFFIEKLTTNQLLGENSLIQLSDNDKQIFSLLWTCDPIRKELENVLSFKIQELPLSVQVRLVSFLQKRTCDIKETLRVFSKKYGISGFTTFLSIEQGGEKMGDKILTLGERLPEDLCQKVFTKYGEIIDNVSKITEFARTNFTKEIETNPELIKKIEETLYIKGKKLLSQTYDDISNKKEINYEDISKQLDRINADTITTFAIFKQAVKNGEKLPIESIEGSIFSKKEASEVTDNQQKEMIGLYETNWKNHPDHAFVESLKLYFKTAFTPESNQQRNHFYTFEKDNHIRAFMRFEKQNDKSLYASALNVDEASKSFGLGEAMMDEALTREAQEHILHASCRKDNPSNMRYFEKGFISKEFKKTNNTEEFNLVWDDNKNKDILSKQKTIEELVLMYLKYEHGGSIEIKKSPTLELLHQQIPEGKSLVRCFQDPLKTSSWYAVYEIVLEDYGVNTGETK